MEEYGAQFTLQAEKIRSFARMARIRSVEIRFTFYSFIGVLGAFLALQSILLAALASAIFLLYYHFVIRSEERRLLDIFKASFSEYISTTPRFIPSYSSYHSSESERIISTKVIERGLREVVWFFVAIALIDTIEVIHSQGFMVLATLPF